MTHRASDTCQMGWALKEGVKGIFVIGEWPNFFFLRNVKWLVLFS